MYEEGHLGVGEMVHRRRASPLTDTPPSRDGLLRQRANIRRVPKAPTKGLCRSPGAKGHMMHECPAPRYHNPLLAHTVRGDQTCGRLDHHSVGRNPPFAASVQPHHSAPRHHADLIRISRGPRHAAVHFLALPSPPSRSLLRRSTGKIVVGNVDCLGRERPVNRTAPANPTAL
jgi:hypothetical protein